MPSIVYFGMLCDEDTNGYIMIRFRPKRKVKKETSKKNAKTSSQSSIPSTTSFISFLLQSGASNRDKNLVHLFEPEISTSTTCSSTSTRVTSSTTNNSLTSTSTWRTSMTLLFSRSNRGLYIIRIIFYFFYLVRSLCYFLRHTKELRHQYHVHTI